MYKPPNTFTYILNNKLNQISNDKTLNKADEIQTMEDILI